jgi:hypothetical protein
LTGGSTRSSSAPQARRAFSTETANRFLVTDGENPYTTPRGTPFLWIRDRILGGRLNSHGRASSSRASTRLDSVTSCRQVSRGDADTLRCGAPIVLRDNVEE